MCLISVPNLNEIHPREGCFFLAQSYCFKSVQRRKMWSKSDNFQKCISCKLLNRFSLNLVCKVMYMKGIKYVNLIEIGSVFVEIRRVENDDLAVPVNNTLVCCMSFLAADTWPCVLILMALIIYTSRNTELATYISGRPNLVRRTSFSCQNWFWG